jgi:hypothetical protein
VGRSYRNRAGYRMGRRCPVEGKASFPSATAAWAFVNNLDNWNGGVARTYRCHHCGWFHLTSKRIYWELRRLAEEAA